MRAPERLARMEQASSSDDEDNVNWAAGDAAGDSSDGEPVLDLSLIHI